MFISRNWWTKGNTFFASEKSRERCASEHFSERNQGNFGEKETCASDFFSHTFQSSHSNIFIALFDWFCDKLSCDVFRFVLSFFPTDFFRVGMFLHEICNAWISMLIMAGFSMNPFSCLLNHWFRIRIFDRIPVQLIGTWYLNHCFCRFDALKIILDIFKWISWPTPRLTVSWGWFWKMFKDSIKLFHLFVSTEIWVSHKWMNLVSN